jgi:imidazolonepropionase-like amidohydrolase
MATHEPTTTLLRGATLIDGSGAAPAPDSAVLIEGERIRWVGPAAAAVVPPGTREIDLAGKTLLPGLIDCHDHMIHTGRDIMQRASAPLSLTMLRIADNLRVTLEAGITTVRDAGGLDVGFKLAVEEGLIPGPRLVLGLTILSRTGGIGDTRLRSGIDLDFMEMPGLPAAARDGVEECRKGVREVLHAGADWVKCASTGGVSSQTLGPTDAALTYDELRVIAEEAHMRDKRVFVHAYGGLGLVDAVAAGIDCVEHGAYLCRHPETLARMAAEGRWLVPTFMVIALHRERGTPWGRRKAADMRDDHRRTLEQAMAAGIPLAMGTDAGGYGHGHNAVELQLLVENGMTPMQAIVASTGDAARLLEMESDIGTLQAGRLADLLVVDGDPLRDIAILDQPERIQLVMKGGKVHVNRLALAAVAPAPVAD